MTSYEIGKRSGISNQVIDRYRKGTNAIENMTFKTAKKLLELGYIKKERVLVPFYRGAVVFREL